MFVLPIIYIVQNNSVTIKICYIYFYTHSTIVKLKVSINATGHHVDKVNMLLIR